MNLILIVICIILGIALVSVWGLWQAQKVQTAKSLAKLEAANHALAEARGFLTSMSMMSIPGVTDGAITALDRIDQLRKENI